MRRFYLFRTNLTNLESYHQYNNNLKDFENNLWDFYLVAGIWLLRNTECEEVTIWRLTKNKSYSIKFKLPNNKLYIQRWVKSLNEVFNYPRPDISLFRGGFKIYDDITKKNSKFFKKKLYLGANGPRRYPCYGGIYDKILIEDERDVIKNCIPFYKIGPPKIFKPLDLDKIYDICWPCNFTQIKQKGHEYFIQQVSKSNILRNSKIVHIGNKPEVGKKLCQKYGITNIKFIGHVDRFRVNKVLNQSKFGVVTSNNVDGCVRTSTEIIGSGTPLLIRNETRLLKHYRNLECVKTFSDNKLEKIYKEAKKNYEEMKQKNLEALENELSMDNIMKMNLKLWVSIPKT